MLGWLFGAWQTVQKFIGRTFRGWAEWAQKEPAAAATQLELIASVLRHRAYAYKRQGGWRARRDRRIASALDEQGMALREAATREHVQAACSVKPGEWDPSRRARGDA